MTADTKPKSTRPSRKRATPKDEAASPSPSEVQPANKVPAARTSIRRVPRAKKQDAQLSILMIASEAHPFAKTGGLAEVAGALPDALARLGHSVTLVLPRYHGVDGGASTISELTLTMGGRPQRVTLRERDHSEGVTLVLVDAPELFDREGLYGAASGDYVDNWYRFAVFSRAALEYQRLKGVRPSIIHSHDWQTGLVPVYQKMYHSDDPTVGAVPSVFTIHNLAFQGQFPASILPDIGLGWEVLNVEAMEFWGRVSYLKGGINFSEKITTVSPGYAKEIVTPEFGFGFEGVVARRAGDLVGILNGIDTNRWDPSGDAFIPAPFSAKALDGKRLAKQALLEATGLAARGVSTERPVVGLVSRLTDQKGFDLITAAASELMGLDVTWVMLGSGERRYEELWRELARRFPGRVSATIGFDERLAHLIEAGADIFLMPSRFEPCGLNQLYSLRYGTIPVVRATGGLDDTVKDAAESKGQGTGFKFRDYSPVTLVSTLRRALEAFKNPAAWKKMQQVGMKLDHSWDASAREYVKVYRTAAGLGEAS
jgi:starch synthase